MKKIIVVIGLMLMMFFMTGCESYRTLPDGTSEPCIGAFDDKDPALVYKLSAQNTAVGLFFAELIVPPVIVIANETLCPIKRITPPDSITHLR